MVNVVLGIAIKRFSLYIYDLYTKKVVEDFAREGYT